MKIEGTLVALPLLSNKFFLSRLKLCYTGPPWNKSLGRTRLDIVTIYRASAPARTQ